MVTLHTVHLHIVEIVEIVDMYIDTNVSIYISTYLAIYSISPAPGPGVWLHHGVGAVHGFSGLAVVLI